MNFYLVPKGKMPAALVVEVTQQCGVFVHGRLTICHFTSDGMSISRLSIAKQNLINLSLYSVFNAQSFALPKNAMPPAIRISNTILL